MKYADSYQNCYDASGEQQQRWEEEVTKVGNKLTETTDRLVAVVAEALEKKLPTLNSVSPTTTAEALAEILVYLWERYLTLEDLPEMKGLMQDVDRIVAGAVSEWAQKQVEQ